MDFLQKLLMTLSEDLLYVTSHKCVDINYNILTGLDCIGDLPDPV